MIAKANALAIVRFDIINSGTLWTPFLDLSRETNHGPIMTPPGANTFNTSLADLIRQGDRRAIARAITLAESTRVVDRKKAEALLTALLPATGNSIRIGISGAPGVGKSTLIEALGVLITSQGHRLAVLAVDPSSRRSGGSILGDKTRMETLARNPDAFIRPSPAGTTLGGVARRTREAMLVVEAGGFDIVLVETVGVGQSETAVADMVDLFVLLTSPGGGDELQGLKRGVMELADIVFVTKADGDLRQAASRAAADYQHALHLIRPKYHGLQPQVLQVSAMEGIGVLEAWEAMQAVHAALKQSGALLRLRQEQRRRWLWGEVQARLIEEIAEQPGGGTETQKIEEEVMAARLPATVAARTLLESLRRS